MPTTGKIDADVLRLLIDSTRTNAAPSAEVTSDRCQQAESGGEEKPKRRKLGIRA